MNKIQGFGRVFFILGAIFIGLFASAKSADPRFIKRGQRVADFVVPVAANELKILSYNVENLFDAVHDEGKTDWEFLPLKHPLKKNCEKEGSYKKQCYETDWTQERFLLKLKQIKRVVDAQGALPDMMALSEIENENVVQALAKQLGYSRFVVTNSPDVRGIDVALMFNESKVAFLNTTEVEVKTQKSRNILVVNFRVNNSDEILGVYVNHWPSQGKVSNSRVEYATALKNYVQQQKSKIPNYNAILVGDFNTIDSDRPHPFHDYLLLRTSIEKFYDVHTLFDGLKSRALTQMPRGTYFYFGEGAWNRLDRFFVSESLLDKKGLELIPESFKIIGPEFMCRAYEYTASDHHLYSSVVFGVPKSYDHNSSNPDTAGYSDHFPIVMKLKVHHDSGPNSDN